MHGPCTSQGTSLATVLFRLLRFPEIAESRRHGRRRPAFLTICPRRSHGRTRSLHRIGGPMAEPGDRTDPSTGPATVTSSAGQPVVIQPVAPQAVAGQAVAGQAPGSGAGRHQATPQAQATRNLAVEAAGATGGIDPMTGQPYTPHKAADDTEQIYFEGSPLIRGVLGAGIGWCLLGVAGHGHPRRAVLPAPPARPVSGRGGSAWRSSWSGWCCSWSRSSRPRRSATRSATTASTSSAAGSPRASTRWNCGTSRTCVQPVLHRPHPGRRLDHHPVARRHHAQADPPGPAQPPADLQALEQRVIAVKRQSGVIKTDSGI